MSDRPGESESEFYNIVKSSPFGLHLYELQPDRGLVFIGANPAADRILGVDNHQFIGQTIEEAFPPLRDTEIPERYRVAAAEGHSWTTKQVDYRDDQIRGAFEVHAFQTAPGRMAAAFVDITERKRAEEAWRQSEEKFRGLAERSLVVIFTIDRQGRLTYISPSVSRLTDYSEEEILGMDTLKFVHPESRPLIEKGLQTVWSGELFERLEVRLERKNGSSFMVETSAAPVIEGGEIVGAQAILRDITERRQAEERDRQHAEELSFLARTAVGFVKLPKAEDIYKYIAEQLSGFIGNRAVVAVTEYDEKNSKYVARAIAGIEEAMGMLTGDLQVSPIGYSALPKGVILDALNSTTLKKIPAGIREMSAGQLSEEAARAIQEYFQFGDFYGMGLIRGDKIFGNLTILSRQGAPAPNAGLVEAFVGQATVALERRRAEEEKAEIEQQLLHAQKLEAIGTLAGGVAHDFNNLLTAILGRAEYLKLSAEPGSEFHSNAAVIEKAALRASELTGQLLGFARKGKIQNIPVDVNLLLDDVLAILIHSIDKRIKIDKIATARNPFTTGDPGQLQQVFVNLAVNARDAMPDGGHLQFEIHEREVDGKPGRYLQVSITDDGPGIAEDVRLRMFEPFFTTKPQGKGTGMGLAVVYGIVDNHGGWVEVESSPAAGSTFSVFLPLQNRPATGTGERSSEPARGTGRILVVDDEEMVRDVAEVMLTSFGYQVTCLEHCQEALEHYREHFREYDLVLLDMIMPVMDGAECFRAIRKINPQARVMIMSGHSDEELSQKLTREGVLEFVRKPFVRSTLAKAVTRALEG